VHTMTTEQAIKHYGGVAKLAKALGITKQAIAQWSDSPPLARQYQLQVMTCGVLRASAPCVQVTH
jgi:transcriptional repressor of cell division inhibition gene dicB